MTFVEGDSDDAWEDFVARSGLGDDVLIYFLHKKLSESERAELAAAGYGVAATWHLYTGEGEIAVAWADVQVAAAIQMIEGGEVVAVPLGQALARAAEAGVAFKLRDAGREYVIDLTHIGGDKLQSA